jgi:hypothetical protein
MSGAGKIGTNMGVHAGSGKGRCKSGSRCRERERLAQIWESMPAAGRVGANPGVDVGSGKDWHKYRCACRQRDGSAQIQVFVPTWVELDYNLGGEIGPLGSQTDTHAKIRECMPGAGRISTNMGEHVGSGKGRPRPGFLIPGSNIYKSLVAAWCPGIRSFTLQGAIFWSWSSLE